MSSIIKEDNRLKYCVPCTVKTITATAFLSTIGIAVFTFAFPLLAKDQGIAGAWLGAAFSGYFFAKLILAPLTGVLADRIGPRPLLIFATFLGMLFPLAYFVSSTHTTLYIIQFGLGLVGGIIKPVGMAVIGTESSEKSCGRLFGWYNLFFNIAFMSGPLLGGLLFYHRDMSMVVLFLALCMLTSFLILTLFLPRHVTTSSKKAFDTLPSRLSPGKTHGLFHLLLAVVGRMTGIAVMISFYPVLLSERLLHSNFVFGVLFSIPSVVTCLALPLTGKLADRFNKTFLTFAGMLISASGLLLAGQVHCVAGFVTIGLILGIGSGISIPASMSMASHMGSNQGKIMGIFHGAANTGFVIGPILAGFVVHQTMRISPAFLAAGIVGIASCLPLGISLARGIGRLRTGYLNIASAFAVCITLSFLPVMLSGQTDARVKDSFRFADVAMGTIVRLTLNAPNEAVADKAAEKAFAAIHRLEKDLGHRHAPGSIGRINLSAGVKPVRVTDTAYSLIERALEFCEKTRGVFDISIGALSVTQSRFYESFSEDKTSLVDYRLVQLNRKERTVFLPRKGMAFDLGGLAKGTIIDCATQVLKNEGVRAGIVEAGGDLLAFGNKNWKCGIQHPRRDELLGVISISNEAVCGSGDYFQYIIDHDSGNHERKHHIINPKQMRSARKSISVTVVAPSTELADALATTLFIMGPDTGKEFLANYFPLSSALWVLPDLKIIKTENFPEFLSCLCSPGK